MAFRSQCEAKSHRIHMEAVVSVVTCMLSFLGILNMEFFWFGGQYFDQWIVGTTEGLS